MSASARGFRHRFKAPRRSYLPASTLGTRCQLQELLLSSRLKPDRPRIVVCLLKLSVRRLPAPRADERVPWPNTVLHRTSIPPIRDEGQFFRIDPSRLLGTFAVARQTSRMSRVASTLRSCPSRRRAERNRVNTEVKNGYPLGEILRNPRGSLRSAARSSRLVCCRVGASLL